MSKRKLKRLLKLTNKEIAKTMVNAETKIMSLIACYDYLNKRR